MKILLRLSFMIALVSILASCGPKGEKAGAGEAEAVAEATGMDYAVNAASSQVMWEGKKIGGTHTGTINVSEGSVSFDKGNLTGGSFTLDMNSIGSTDLEGDKKMGLDSHLKGTAEGKEDHFFNVAKFPTAKFEITKVTKLMNNEDANYVVNGNLTMRDQTKSVSFRAMVKEEGGKVSVSTPQFTIDRTEWGVKYGSAKFFDDLKDKAINDEIGLQVNLMAG